jgi:hypothetical protein
MSQEVIDALASGQITPVEYWVRHASSWKNIAESTPLDDVEVFFTELTDDAFDVAEFLAYNPSAVAHAVAA